MNWLRRVYDDISHIAEEWGNSVEENQAKESILSIDFENIENYTLFEVEELNGNINKWNNLERWDVVCLKFEKYGKEKSFNFTLRFYITRSYSHKIVWYYFIENLIEKQKSEVIYGEIKYTKIKSWRRKILEENISITDPIINNVKTFINEAILVQIQILKSKEKVQTFVNWFSGKILQTIKKSWNEE